MMPAVVVVVRGAPAAEGRPILLVGDDAEVRRRVAAGDVALSPAMVEALAAIARTFPGARVEAVRRG